MSFPFPHLFGRRISSRVLLESVNGQLNQAWKSYIWELLGPDPQPVYAFVLQILAEGLIWRKLQIWLPPPSQGEVGVVPGHFG